MDGTTPCESCGREAVARVHTQWLCARCGLHRTAVVAGLRSDAAEATSPVRSWRTPLKAAIGSGLAAKVLIGAAALAAVGGAVATDPALDLVPPSDPPPTVAPIVPATSSLPEDLPPSTNATAAETTAPGIGPADADNASRPIDVAENPANVQNYIEAVHEWSGCVEKAEHNFANLRPVSGERFNPFDACGERPNPRLFGVGSESPDSAETSDDSALQRPDHAGPPDDPGSQSNAAHGKPE